MATPKVDPIKLANQLERTAETAQALVVVAREHLIINRAIRNVVGRGVPVICLTTDLPTSGRTVYVGNDQTGAGATAAYLMGQAVGNREGNILLVYSAPYRVQEDRELGFRRVLRVEFPLLKVDERVNSNDETDLVYANVVRYIADHGPPVGIYNTASGNVGIGKALSDHGLAGKTVFIGFLIAMLARQRVTQVVFDKDRGLEILVRALGGEYFPLESGPSTGFNPLQLSPTPPNVEFLKTWLQSLSMRSSQSPHVNAVREQADLEQALRGTLALEPRARRLSRLVEFLDPTEPEGLHARLSRWCEVCGGEYAWVFDNPLDTLASRLAGRAVVGFDVTEFLDHALIRAPITLYLFHVVRRLLDGRRLVCWMDEFWRLVADPAFESFARDGPKTWRKLNGVMCLATQSASDVLESPISRTLVEQTPTKIFFPNADAQVEDYTEGFGLTRREFRLIKEQLEPGSRKFLVKQAHHSVVCQLDLKGFDPDLAVISGRADAVARMRDIIRAKGSNPSIWLPIFMSTAADSHARRE